MTTAEEILTAITVIYVKPGPQCPKAEGVSDLGGYTQAYEFISRRVATLSHRHILIQTVGGRAIAINIQNMPTLVSLVFA